jgi:hypothetical protein
MIGKVYSMKRNFVITSIYDYKYSVNLDIQKYLYTIVVH